LSPTAFALSAHRGAYRGRQVLTEGGFDA